MIGIGLRILRLARAGATELADNVSFPHSPLYRLRFLQDASASMTGTAPSQAFSARDVLSRASLDDNITP